MGRPRKHYDDNPQVQLNTRINADLAAKVRIKLEDPVRNKTKHGSLQELITALLYNWVDDNHPISSL